MAWHHKQNMRAHCALPSTLRGAPSCAARKTKRGSLREIRQDQAQHDCDLFRLSRLERWRANLYDSGRWSQSKAEENSGWNAAANPRDCERTGKQPRPWHKQSHLLQTLAEDWHSWEGRRLQLAAHVCTRKSKTGCRAMEMQKLLRNSDLTLIFNIVQYSVQKYEIMMLVSRTNSLYFRQELQKRKAP